MSRRDLRASPEGAATDKKRQSYERSKRALDVVVGAPLALVVLPVLAFLAVAVMVSLRTWRPIFVQDRVGRGGRRLRLPKLRTLPATTPRYADKYAIAAVTTTRLGRLLRRTHLDELPQLLLVPLGWMSLVGPRPEMPRLARQFDPEFATARVTARPGCTGLWQISTEADKLIGEAPEYDLHYLEHRSLSLDAWILWRTLVSFLPTSSRVSFDDLGRVGPRRRNGFGGEGVAALTVAGERQR